MIGYLSEPSSPSPTPSLYPTPPTQPRQVGVLRVLLELVAVAPDAVGAHVPELVPGIQAALQVRRGEGALQAGPCIAARPQVATCGCSRRSLRRRRGSLPRPPRLRMLPDNLPCHCLAQDASSTGSNSKIQALQFLNAGGLLHLVACHNSWTVPWSMPSCGATSAPRRPSACPSCRLRRASPSGAPLPHPSASPIPAPPLRSHGFQRPRRLPAVRGAAVQERVRGCGGAIL